MQQPLQLVAKDRMPRQCMREEFQRQHMRNFWPVDRFVRQHVSRRRFSRTSGSFDIVEIDFSSSRNSTVMAQAGEHEATAIASARPILIIALCPSLYRYGDI